jgi:hypothetical protein
MMGLTSAPLHPQVAQWIDSYCRIHGHEPSADEISQIEAKYNLPMRGSTHGPASPSAAVIAPDAAAPLLREP